MRVRISMPLLAALIMGGAGQAKADLIGSSVTSQYYDSGGTYNNFGSPATFVANGSVQETFCSDIACPEGFNLTITGNQIIYDLFGSGGYWSPSSASLNSGGLFIANGNLLTFSGVTISGATLDGSSDVPGFTGANVTFNANNVAIDWAGLSGIAPGDRVILDVTTSAVPEPAGWPLLIGFAGIGMLWQRIGRRVAA